MSTLLARKHVSENVQIPTLPQVVATLNALCDDPEVGTREIGAAVAQDAPISAKVLKIANSAYYGLRERVLSTEHAAAVLGVRVLRNIAMQASVIRQFDHLMGHPDVDLAELWRHSILTGDVCAYAATRCRRRLGPTPDELRVIGLLHDMGKVVMLDSLDEPFLEAVHLARVEQAPLHVCEERVLGFNHTHVGAVIASRWGLPASVVDAIQYHHGPREALERDPLVALVANVNLVVHRVAEHSLSEAEAAVDAATLDLLGLRPADLEGIVQFAAELLPRIEI